MKGPATGFKKKLYGIIGILILLYCGYIVDILIMHIWHSEPTEEADQQQHLSHNEKLYQDMIEGVDGKKGGIAVKDINQVYKLYDFHRANRKAVIDSHNLCVSCHGDVPHDKKREIRSFLNMHAYFMACETCHVRAHDKSSAKYAWYDKLSGKVQPNVELSQYLGDTEYKLMPVDPANPERSIYDSDDMRKYVAAFKKNVTTMMPSAKSAAINVIHRPVGDVKNAVRCDECHNANASQTYLPFTQIGYPERRAQQLIGNEVVGMVNKYKKFYLPNFLKPDEDHNSDK